MSVQRTKKELQDLGIPLTYDEWTDPCGNVYRPGDHVAVATISGRSPQLVIAKVVSINRVNSKGEEIGKSSFDGGDPELDAALAECRKEQPRLIAGANQPAYDAWRKRYDPLVQAWRKSRKPIFHPSCTVTCLPSIDGRNFYRTKYADGTKVKKITYQFPGNIVKVTINPDLHQPVIDDLKEMHNAL